MKYLSIEKLEGVSSLCLGGGKFGSQIKETAVFDQMDAFAEVGGNFVDTAHIYGAWDPEGAAGGCGNSEVVIGNWMKKQGCRDRMIIGTKGGHPDFDTGESRLSEKWIRQHLAESLDHLQTDYVDLYFFHRDDPSIPVEDMLGWLKDPVDQGIIRQLACSNWRIERVLEARLFAEKYGLPLLAANQISWSMAQANEVRIHNKYGEQIIMDGVTWEKHRQNQIPVIAYNAQASGFFAKFEKSTHSTIASFVETEEMSRFRKYNNALTQQRINAVRDFAQDQSCSLNQLALAWMLHQPFPTIPIIGPNNRDQLQDSLKALAVNLPSQAWG